MLGVGIELGAVGDLHDVRSPKKAMAPGAGRRVEDGDLGRDVLTGAEGGICQAAQRLVHLDHPRVLLEAHLRAAWRRVPVAALELADLDPVCEEPADEPQCLGIAALVIALWDHERLRVVDHPVVLRIAELPGLVGRVIREARQRRTRRVVVVPDVDLELVVHQVDPIGRVEEER